MKYLILKSSLQIPLSDNDANRLAQVLTSGTSGFMNIGGNLLNTNEIVAIVDDKMSDDMKHSHRGQWKCENGYWHERFDACECRWKKYTDLGKSTFSTNGELGYGSTIPQKPRLLGDSIPNNLEVKKF